MLTKEEIQKALKTEEGKALLNDAIEAATKPLKANRDDILEKLNKSKETVSSLEERFTNLENAANKAADEAADKSGDIDAIKSQIEKRHKTELEDRDSKINKLTGQLDTHVIGEGLTKQLIKAGVAPNFMDAATALIKSKFKGEVGDNDGKPFAKFDGKAVSEFVADWAQGDEGKNFVSADNNSGGGSHGTPGKGQADAGAKTITRSDFDALHPTARSGVAANHTIVDD